MPRGGSVAVYGSLSGQEPSGPFAGELLMQEGKTLQGFHVSMWLDSLSMAQKLYYIYMVCAGGGGGVIV